MNGLPYTLCPTVSQLVTGYEPDRIVWTYRKHGTTDWLLVHTLSGQGRFRFPGGQIDAHPDEMVLLQPGTLHDYASEPMDGRWEALWAHFHPLLHWLPLLDWPEEGPGLMRIRLSDPSIRDKVVRRFFEADRLAKSALPHKELFAMNALEEVLLWCDTQNPRSRYARLDARVHQAMDYLCAHLHEEITLATLASICCLSASRLSHLFQEQLGITPHQFLEQQRIRRAKQLLELTPHPVQRVAQEVGYSSQCYFSNRFKRHVGISPRQYRQRASG